MITKDEFLEFFYDNDAYNQLDPDEKIDIFLHSLHGSADITKELLDSLLGDFCVENLEIIELEDTNE